MARAVLGSGARPDNGRDDNCAFAPVANEEATGFDVGVNVSLSHHLLECDGRYPGEVAH